LALRNTNHKNQKSLLKKVKRIPGLEEITKDNFNILQSGFDLIRIIIKPCSKLQINDLPRIVNQDMQTKLEELNDILLKFVVSEYKYEYFLQYKVLRSKLLKFMKDKEGSVYKSLHNYVNVNFQELKNMCYEGKCYTEKKTLTVFEEESINAIKDLVGYVKSEMGSSVENISTEIKEFEEGIEQMKMTDLEAFEYLLLFKISLINNQK
jgi:hypothetical protein